MPARHLPARARLFAMLGKRVGFAWQGGSASPSGGAGGDTGF